MLTQNVTGPVGPVTPTHLVSTMQIKYVHE